MRTCRMNFTLAAAATLMLVWVGVSARGQNARDIMQQVEDRQQTASSAMRVSMHIFDRTDAPDSRDLYLQTYARGEDASYTEFVSPRSICGLRVLDLNGDVRVFFPSTGRVRLISGKQKSGSVGGVGGDFTYEDMGGGSLLKDYTFEMERDEPTHYVIRAVPRDEDSSYEYLLFSVNKGKLVVDRIEYYTRAHGKEKTMTADEFRVIQGREIATIITMENHWKRQRTVLRIHQAAFDVAVDDRFFNPNRFYR